MVSLSINDLKRSYYLQVLGVTDVGQTVSDLEYEFFSQSGASGGQMLPKDLGFEAWSFDPVAAVNSQALVNGTVYLTRIDIRSELTVTKLHWGVTAAGSTPVSGQNEVGIYNSAGTKLASANVDADISSTGSKTTTIAATKLIPGFYWVALLFNAVTPPNTGRGAGSTGALTRSDSIGVEKARFATAGTSQTALPASIVPANNVTTTFAGPWAALGSDS